MSDDILKTAREVLRLADAAYEGPWAADSEDTDAGPMSIIRRAELLRGERQCVIAMTDVSPFDDERAWNEANADFIAHARAAGPELAKFALLVDEITRGLATLFQGEPEYERERDMARGIRKQLGLPEVPSSSLGESGSGGGAMSRTDITVRKLVVEDDIRPIVDRRGIPRCNEQCPSHDGKRCMAMGFRPEGTCEPAIITMAQHIAGNGGTSHEAAASAATKKDPNAR